jgi:predicted RNA-binding Zn ribbon-like protein
VSKIVSDASYKSCDGNQDTAFWVTLVLDRLESSKGVVMATHLADPESEPHMPPDMSLVRDFVNTIDYDDGTDLLTSPDELATFLHDAGVLSRRTPASDDEVALARTLRAGLRDALAANHSEDSRPIPELDGVFAVLPMRLHWGGDAPTLVPTTTGVTGALAQIAIAVNGGVADGTWSRLKICPDDTCAWAYYDTSKNRSKNWCGVTCGNKAKTRAYRARKKSGVETPMDVDLRGGS